MKRVTVLSTGSELLSGKVRDINASYVCGLLYPLAVDVRMIMVVGDDITGLERAIGIALEGSEILIITGGLGPTDDDNTIAALSRILRLSTCIDENAQNKMESFFASMGIEVSPADLKMVEIPAGSRAVENPAGLAPGFIIHERGVVIIALPGVPGEMRCMLENSVMPYLLNELGIHERSSITFRVTGMKESEINALIGEMDLPGDTIEWGITAGGGVASVTLVSKVPGRHSWNHVIDRARKSFGPRYLDPRFQAPEEEVVHRLREEGLTVSFAESCTGGLVAKRITDIPGSSDVFAGAVVAYGNEAKMAMLNVKPGTLADKGAVSEEVAAEMAAGAMSAMKTDIAVAITGIAGPGGGTASKPVGMVCFGMSHAGGVRTHTRIFSGGRDRIRTFASLAAIEMLRDHLFNGT